MKKLLAFGLLLVFVKASAFAQAPLTLPFFDDFAKFNNRLDPTKWEPGGGAYLNDHFSETPVSKNIVTFNGYSAEGELGFATNPANIDSLTSRPINLGGLAVSDSVYLSFYLQTGGLGNTPTTTTVAPVFFQILFKDNTGTWQEARRINPPNPVNFTPNFHQYIIRITNASFLHNNFQFMFRGFGRSRFSLDTWNLDYVQLDANRRVNEQRQDVAISRRPQPVLKRYTAMPMHQLIINGNLVASELNDSLYATLNNLESSIRNIPNFTALQVGNGPEVVSAPQTIAIPPLARQFRTSNNSPAAGAFAGVSGFQTVKSTVFITSIEPTVQTQYNDTISRFTALHNYYAFDDGTPEDVISVFQGTGTGMHAHRFFANQPDMVESLQVYIPTSQNTQGRQITFHVWGEGTDGKPDANNMVPIPYNVPHVSQLNRWITIPVNPPAPVSGGFFVGWSNARSFLFTVGLDKSERKNGIIHFTDKNVWLTSTNNPGALMLRAVMNNNILNTGLAKENLAQQIKVYPNPATDHVILAGNPDLVTVRSVTGQLLMEKAGQPGETRLDLGHLPAGLYLLQVQSKNSTYTHKLILNPYR